ncbi:MAG: hypothetical protein KBD01_07750 [Acidobacteria bacterium]|nr:hypothetical protein [Acidobacteriota bacterium]
MSRRRALRIALGVLLASLAVLAAVAWLLRDLPRRLVEDAIARRLVAEVDLGGLRVQGTRQFELRRLRVRRMAGMPLLDELRIETLHVGGSVREILGGRFERLALDGLRVRLARPPPGTELPPAGPPSEVLVRQLVIGGGEVVIAGSGAEARFRVSGEVRDVGAVPLGQLSLSGEDVPLAPILALAGAPTGWDGRVQELRGSLVAGAGGRIELRGGARTAVVTRGERSLALPGPAFEATIEGEPSAQRLAARATLPLAREVRLAATIDRTAGRPRDLDIVVKGLDLAPLVELLAPPAQRIALAGSLDIAVDGPHPRYHYALDARLARAAYGEAEVRAVALDLDGSVDVSLGPDASARGTVSVGGARASLGALRIPAGLWPATGVVDVTAGAGAEKSARGNVELRSGAGLLKLRGACAAPAAGGWSADGAFEWGGGRLETLLALARAAGIALPPELEAAGALRVRGTFAGGSGRATGVAGTIAVAGLAASAGAARVERASLDVRGTARVESDGTLTAAGTVQAADIAACAGPALVKGGRLAARAAWDGKAGAAQLHDLRAGLPLALADAQLPLEVRASASFAPGREFVLREARATGPAGSEVTAEGSWRAGGGRFSVRAGNVDVAAWRGLLAPQTLAGYEPSGKASAQASIELDAALGWTARGTAALQGAGFSSSDGSTALDGLGLSSAFEAEGVAARLARASARADLSGFQFLAGVAFGDYSGAPSVVRLDYGAGTPGAWRVAGRWELPAGVTVAGALEPGAGALRYELDLAAPDLGGAFDQLVRAPLANSLAELERLRAGGSLRLQLQGTRGDGGLTAAGQLALQKVGLWGAEELFQLRGLDVEAPLDLVWRADGTIDGPPRDGRLAFERASLHGLELPGVSAPLAIAGDTVTMRGSITVPVLDGGLLLENVALADVLSPQRSLQLGLFVGGIELGQLSKAVGLPPLSGEVDAQFPRIAVTGGTVEVDGGGKVEIFGGEVTLGNISARDIFSRFPRAQFSARFSGIDLEQVTRRFDFGEMTGLVRGSFSNVELFGAVPVSFRGRVRSERGGTVNVRAVRNIAVLGGSSPTIFDRGLTRLFQRFTYSGLGIEMRLKNDVFRLKGLEHRGDKELFLKGRLPLPIDVVNGDPGRAVSFRAMLDRFRSLDLSQVEAR